MLRRRPLVLLFPLLLLSCSMDQEQDGKAGYLPDASGELSQLVVIYDKANTDTGFKEAVDAVFAAPIPAIPLPSEPRFKVLYTDETFVKGYFKRHHNIFVLLTSENMDRLVKTYGKDNADRIREIMQTDGALGYNKEDVWAKGQNVFYITARTEEELFQKLRDRGQELLDVANANEERTARLKTFNYSLKKDTFYQHTMADRGYSVRHPFTYDVLAKTKDFVYLRKEANSYVYGILLYHAPYTSREQFELDHIIQLRESFCKRFVQDDVTNSYMSISPVISPDTFSIIHKGHYAMRTEGWWRMSNRFMAGPFLSHSVYDDKGGRVIVAEGYIYGPNRKKAIPLREIETIIKSLDIQ